AFPLQSHDRVGIFRNGRREAKGLPVLDIEGDAISLTPHRLNVRSEAVAQVNISGHLRTHKKNGIGFNSRSSSGRLRQPMSTGAWYSRPSRKRAQKCRMPGITTRAVAKSISG